MISQYKGDMIIKQYMEILARMADAYTDDGMPKQQQAELDPKLKALYATKMKYAKQKFHAKATSGTSPTKSTTVTSEAKPGTYTNKMISKNIVVVPEESPYNPSKWDNDTHHLDGKVYTMVEQYRSAGPMLKKMIRECTSVSYGQTTLYAVTIAIKDMLMRELTRKEEITTDKTPEAIAVEKEWKAKHPPKDQATKYAIAVEAFKQMGKEEVENKLNTTNTHLNQIELKVSKLLSEGTPTKNAITTTYQWSCTMT